MFRVGDRHESNYAKGLRAPLISSKTRLSLPPILSHIPRRQLLLSSLFIPLTRLRGSYFYSFTLIHATVIVSTLLASNNTPFQRLPNKLYKVVHFNTSDLSVHHHERHQCCCAACGSPWCYCCISERHSRYLDSFLLQASDIFTRSNRQGQWYERVSRIRNEQC